MRNVVVQNFVIVSYSDIISGKEEPPLPYAPAIACKYRIKKKIVVICKTIKRLIYFCGILIYLGFKSMESENLYVEKPLSELNIWKNVNTVNPHVITAIVSK